MDVSLIRTGDISETQVCPLARMVRRRLHRRGVFTDIRCVYSLEVPVRSTDTTLLPDQASDASGEDTGHGRQRPPIGTIPWIPGIFGLTLAAEAVRIITR